MSLKRTLYLLAPLLLAACGSQPAAGAPVPALLVAPTTAVRAQLQQVVSEALHGVPVTLADDALTRESLLLIERAQPRDAGGRLIQGRDPGAPAQFRLFLGGGNCYLQQLPSGQRWVLEGAECAAEQ
ncbi:hypothetical protein [Microbulbifer sp. SAOS-129_SWC]|uniref:hypothetical protein n=1 Tax=Microbulbifer sp. SAOS-129_SWC TaxID=3145235 RepID=UPI003216AF60